MSFAALIPAGDDSDPLDSHRRRCPPGWRTTTVKAAGSLALAGAAIESVVPAAVAALSRGVARTLVLTKVRAAAALVVLAVAGVSIGLAATYPPADEPRRAAAAHGHPPHATIAKHEAHPTEDRSPMPLGSSSAARCSTPTANRSSARRSCWLPPSWTSVTPGLPADWEPARTDGRFEVTIARGTPSKRKASVGPACSSGPCVAPIAPGLGPDWVRDRPPKTAGPITLRLRRDDVPVEGRVVSLEGRPAILA